MALMLCFYMSEFEENEKAYEVIMYFISIQHEQQPSIFTHPTIRSCRVGLKF